MALPTVTTRVPKILIALTLRMTLDIIVPAVKVIEAMLIFAMAVKILMSAKLEKARCAQQAECKNTAGAYYCSCPKGYLVDATDCFTQRRSWDNQNIWYPSVRQSNRQLRCRSNSWNWGILFALQSYATLWRDSSHQEGSHYG
ncbi:hypothetical protein QYF36_000875 [Acer negundo]|nr:hypothetical protein QYF36_000875 [Acer negundo]